MLSNSGKCTGSSPIGSTSWAARSQQIFVALFLKNQFIYLWDDCFVEMTETHRHQMFSVRIMSFKCSRVHIIWHDKRLKQMKSATTAQIMRNKMKSTQIFTYELRHCIEHIISKGIYFLVDLNDINWWLKVVFLDFEVPSLLLNIVLSVDRLAVATLFLKSMQNPMVFVIWNRQ